VRTHDVIDVLEACYRMDSDDDAWLGGIAEAVAGALGGGRGAFAFRSDGTTQAIRCSRNFDPSWLGSFVTTFAATQPDDAEAATPLERTTRAFAPFLAGRSTLMSAVPACAPLMPLVSTFGGARDLLTLNGFSPDGRGLSLAIPLDRRGVRKTHVLDRITTHLAAAHRLRHRLAATPAGVLDDRGELVDANDSEIIVERDTLRHATHRREAARGPLRRDDASATASWQGLVSARWSLTDGFAHGRRYVVVRANQVLTPDVASLAERERQVIALASMGHTNKEVAYELGLAQSTVRVLMARAADKLGAQGRTDAIARYRALLSA
jgi:DNA-binding CsgD family transcriptional regulator